MVVFKKFRRSCMVEKKVDLDLRRKIAELDGWTDITQVRVDTLSGKFPNKKRDATADWFTVPAYEISFDAIAEACDRHGIKFSLSMFEDCHQVKSTSVNEEKLRTEKKREVVRWSFTGETRAIALCNLFIAVMEARAKDLGFLVGGIKSGYTSEGRELKLGEGEFAGSVTTSTGDRIFVPFRREIPVNPIGEQVIERLNITTPFSRGVLKQIREKARFAFDYEFGSVKPSSIWGRAYEDLAIAADRLDAMLARKEWAKNEYGGEEESSDE